jgi:hypothetical protein
MNTANNVATAPEKQGQLYKPVVVHDADCAIFKGRGSSCSCTPTVSERQPGEFWWIR